MLQHKREEEEEEKKKKKWRRGVKHPRGVCRRCRISPSGLKRKQEEGGRRKKKKKKEGRGRGTEGADREIERRGD